MTAKERDIYEKDGFFVVKNLVPKDKTAAYKKRFKQICDGEVRVPGCTIMKDIAIAKTTSGKRGEKYVSKIQTFVEDDVLLDYCKLPEMMNYASSITGPNIMAMHTMMFNKPPDPGTLTSHHPMHQDLLYFPFRPADKIVASWRKECKNSLGGVNAFYYDVKGYNPNSERVYLEMEEGDTVFFHPILVHGSGTNKTKDLRKAMSCHFAVNDCYYIDVKGTSQKAVGEIIYSKDNPHAKKATDKPDYGGVWKLRAKLVAGKRMDM